MSAIAFLRDLLADGVPLDAALIAADRFEQRAVAAEAARIAERREKDAARQARRRSKMPEDWYALRAVVFERDDYTCTYCGAHTDDPHCDHIEPLSRGGSNDLSNLTTACAKCNVSKGARSPSEWKAV